MRGSFIGREESGFSQITDFNRNAMQELGILQQLARAKSDLFRNKLPPFVHSEGMLPSGFRV